MEIKLTHALPMIPQDHGKLRSSEPPTPPSSSITEFLHQETELVIPLDASSLEATLELHTLFPQNLAPLDFCNAEILMTEDLSLN
jgi:hypothetical protein